MRSTSPRVRSATARRCRLGGRGGVPGGSARWMSGIGCLLRCGNQQDGVLLVHLDQLHLYTLGVRRGQVLADEVGSDRKLAVTAIDEDRELHASRASVVEERLDSSADRPAGVEDVVDEHHRPALERKVERGAVHHRLRVQRGAAVADEHVVAVESRPRVTGLAACVALVAASAVGHAVGAWGVAAGWIASDEPTYGMLGRSLWHDGTLTVVGAKGPFYGIVYPALAGLPLTVFG